MDIRRRMLFKKKASSSGGGGSTTGGSYTVNLNSQWEATTVVPNPDSTLYDGVYRSSSSYNVNNGVSIMYITIKDCSSFKMYIRSYAESNYDYVMVSQLDKTINGNTTYSDTTLVKAHTRGNQQSGTTLSNYTLVEFTGITSGEHTITVVYRKDGSVNSGDDRGYVLIEKIQESPETPEEPETGGTTNLVNVGEVAYWNGNSVKTIPIDKWDISLGTAIGVVVIPDGFAPDGKVRIIGLKPMEDNGNMVDTHQYLKWGVYGAYTSLTNYEKVPITNNTGSTSSGSDYHGNLPSDNFSGTQSYVDPIAKYDDNWRDYWIPSPYLGDAPNPEYYRTIYGNNALSDFNGLTNTHTLVGLGSDYKAANACWNYKDSTNSNVQWYLPAIGELGYLMTRFKTINEVITSLGGVAVDGNGYFWSSSQYSSKYAYFLATDNGNISYINNDGGSYVRTFAMVEIDNSINTDNYLTIEALEDGLTASLSTNACEYCVDGDGNWKSLSAGSTTESINSGHTLSFRGDLTPTSSAGIGTFTIYKKCNLKGNCMSMLFKDNAANNYSLSGKNYAFYKLFYNCTNIVNVSSNFLPATTLASYCYQYMLYGCTNLTTAPKLPAKRLTTDCYSYMFRDCTSLTTAPELPATTLASSCYEDMFYGCTSLTTAPALPATTLSNWCYYFMFDGCTSLTSAPKLPATRLATKCYTCMFSDCTSLTTAPALPATTLAEGCYSTMFGGCTNLTTAPELPATTLTRECYSWMFYDCTSLTTAPALPATTLKYECYEYMFKGCTSLTTAPELPATTLETNCYQCMFRDCTSLTKAPTILPATTLEGNCYDSMFYGCTSLTKAPILPATTLASACYQFMFRDCTKLNYIKMLATDIPDSWCLNNWVKNVASSGTFVKNPAMSTGNLRIPSGWTVVNDGEESGGNLTFPVTLVEGDNGQLGIDLFNYLIDKYDEPVSFNEHSITEQITINSTSGSRYNGDVVNILTQLNSLQENPTWIRIATQSILNQGAFWYSCDYFILRNNGYLEYFND